ncbi:hypothetical protein H696_05347 [Fonticula alba]|uniref:PX domain-containing protein n=1 Tax=Fonticula alba TaxID=691883 RepID=A0A058Z1G5_FONAL|nr:hypothetical protein H696_05347 [Fonticula alba]KCV68095.1 hypothetical protein H696_05347 [Fonticula alba]|eukprot:XP_009497469.1 hypothetical protein H696_05347 [Fonticula alba]
MSTFDEDPFGDPMQDESLDQQQQQQPEEVDESPFDGEDAALAADDAYCSDDVSSMTAIADRSAFDPTESIVAHESSYQPEEDTEETLSPAAAAVAAIASAKPAPVATEKEEAPAVEDIAPTYAVTPILDETTDASVADIPTTRLTEVSIRPAASGEYATPPITVRVFAPEKISEGLSSYAVYTIAAEINSPSFSKTSIKCPRRYSHFDWLFNQLTANYPGHVVPPIPDKDALNRFDEKVLEMRQVGLERFLRRLVTHPELHKCEEVVLFFESDDLDAAIKSWSKRPPSLGVPAPAPAPSSGGFFSSFTSSLSTAMSSAVQSASSSFAKFADPDPFLAARRSHIEMFDARLQNLHRILLQFEKAHSQRVAQISQFAGALEAAAQTEKDGSLAGGAGQPGSRVLSQALAELTAAQTQYAEAFAAGFSTGSTAISHCVHDYIRFCASIITAFNQRAKIHHGWQTAQANLEKARQNLAKVRFTGNTRKIEVAEHETKQAEKACEEAQEQFERVTKTLRTDLDLFDAQRLDDFHLAIESLVSQLIQAYETIIAKWRECVAALDQLAA